MELEPPRSGCNAQGAIKYSSRNTVKAHTDTDDVRGHGSESVNTWYEQDWMKLDPKLRTSCVEGISSFLSLFDMADVAANFLSEGPAGEGRGPHGTETP